MTNLIIIGIWITPYFVSHQFGFRDSQFLMSSFFMLSFFLYACYRSQVFICKNKWLLAFILFIPISIFLAPKINIPLFGKATYFWFPAFCMVSHFLGFAALSAAELDTERITKHIVWAAALMSVYVILQSIGIDQFFYPLNDHPKAWSATSPFLTGTLGNSRVVGAYLALCLPAFYHRRDWKAGIVLSALVLIESKLAWFGVLAGFYVYFAGKSPKRLGFGVLLAVLAIFAYYAWDLPDSARLSTWLDIWLSFRAGLAPNGNQFCLTGYGFGSFPYFFSYPHLRIWLRAHNEYIEILWQFGVIGFGLLMMAVWHHLRNCNRIQPFFAMFCSSLVMAGGFFIWQIGPIAYLTVLAGAVVVRNDN